MSKELLTSPILKEWHLNELERVKAEQKAGQAAGEYVYVHAYKLTQGSGGTILEKG